MYYTRTAKNFKSWTDMAKQKTKKIKIARNCLRSTMFHYPGIWIARHGKWEQTRERDSKTSVEPRAPWGMTNDREIQHRTYPFNKSARTKHSVVVCGPGQKSKHRHRLFKKEKNYNDNEKK